MTIMQPDRPLSLSGITTAIYDAVAESFPLFEEVQDLAKGGVFVAFEVAPSRIVVSVSVSEEALHLLPALLEEIEGAQLVQPVFGGGLAVTGTICQQAVTVRVMIPQGWVSAGELAVLAGAAEATGYATAGC